MYRIAATNLPGNGGWRKRKKEEMKQKKKQSRKKPGKRKEPLLLWIGAGVVILLGFGVYYLNAPPAIGPVSGGDLETGARVFKQNCSACHGPGAIGENPRMPKGGTKPDGVYLAPALNGTGHAWHHPDEMLFEIIKNGSAAKESPMRGFAGIMTEEEMMSVLQYIKSLWPEKIRRFHAQRSG